MRTLMLIIILIVPGYFCFAQNSPTPGLNETKPPTIEDLKVAEPGQGLGNRSDLIKHLCELDSDFVFKQIKDVDGQPNFYANDKYNTSVEIVGQESFVVMARWTFNMIPNNSQATHMEIKRMGVFAGGVGGKDCLSWFSNVFLNFKDNLLNSYSESKEFDLNRSATFVYSPQSRKMILTITLKPPTIEDLKVAMPKGLGNRAGLIRYASGADSDFVFKRRDDVDGKPDYYASNRHSTSVEFEGSDDKIDMVKWTMNFVPNKETDNITELDRMSYFTMIISNDHDWFTSFYKKIVTNFKKAYTETKEFPATSKVGVLNYSPEKKCISLTMTNRD